MPKKKFNLLLKINAFIILLSIIIAIIYSIVYFVRHDYFMAISSIVVIILPPLIYAIDRIIKGGVPDVVKTSYLLFVFASAILGAIANFYGTIPLYDKVIHFLSGVLVSWSFAVAYERFNKNIKHNVKWLIFYLTVFNTAIAAYWEICEFSFDFVFNKQVQRGLTDTMTDMIVAIVGGIIITFIYIHKYSYQQRISKTKSTVM